MVNNKVHIIIPVYNESKAIISVLGRIFSVMDSQDFYITIFDDGSTDDSFNLIKKHFPQVEAIQNPRNLGKGLTIRRSIKYIKKNEIVVYMDADGEHKPEDLPRIIEPIKNQKAHVVIGSRFLQLNDDKEKNGSYLNNQKSFRHIRKFGNLLFSFITYLLYQTFISDTQCGYRAYAPNVIQQFRLKTTGFQVEIEMTLEAIKKRYIIHEIPILSGRSTRNSHMRMVKDSIKIIFVIIQKKLPTVIQDILTPFFSWMYNK
jgi:glycosyltransferase involved in cell wall biosynthesis